MGVPAFFKKLSKKYNIIRNNPDRPIKSLYIDGNCLIHPQCFLVLSQYPNVTNQQFLFKKMFKRIVDYIDYMIRLTNPSDLVYIAIDGVAPVAKISQQRVRRFANAVNNYRTDIYKKHNVPINDSWSNIVITPGTEFMYELHNDIKNYYAKQTKKRDPKITYQMIYDSYLTPGEGEHKILQHLKSHTSNKEEKATIIYGLDADLIFLSMASQIPNIFLLRESSQFKSNQDAEDIGIDPYAVEQELCYADIDFTKKSINDEFNKYYSMHIQQTDDYKDSDLFGDKTEKTSHQKISTFDFTNDYIFICYFLGNDFLPHLPSIDINIDGLEILINAYMDVFKLLGRNIITLHNSTVSIDNEFLIEFIRLISLYEDDFFRTKQPENLRKQFRRRCFETEPHKIDIWMIENLRTVKIHDPVQLGVGHSQEWKFRYYDHYFKTSEHMTETVNQVCYNYIQGLLWVAKYYFEKCPSWRWMYCYTHAPFLSDLYMYLHNKDISKDVKIIYEPRIDMYTQLVSVIPSVYSNILPSNLRYLNSSYDSPIIDLYPIKYQIDMINKTQLYKCVPIIPFLDISRVEKCVKSVKLSKSEKDREMEISPIKFV